MLTNPAIFSFDFWTLALNSKRQSARKSKTKMVG